jgi:replication factor C subunit 2/4
MTTFHDIPWTEKYRPKTIDDIIINKNTKNKLKNIIEGREMPNMIFAGVPGVGKTSTLLYIANTLFGKYVKNGVLELNASDDRGIKSVQALTSFCKKKLNIKDEDLDKFSKQKIILFDEADNMTRKAQQLVNNLMELYNKTTRFAFTCNNSTDIIEAIQSRCIIFRYQRLSSAQVKKRLIEIAKIEKLDYDDEGIDAVVTTAQGDMRQGLNNLQLTHCGYGKITQDNVLKICSKPHPSIVKNILYACDKKDIKTALKGLVELKDIGFSNHDITFELINIIKTSTTLNLKEKTKIKFMNELSKAHFNISKGVDTFLQATGCIATLCM